MTESALAAEAEASDFDAVLVVRPEASRTVGGMRLVERGAFALARAGVRRLLCVGIPPATDLRMPPVEITWATSDTAIGAWAAGNGRSIVGLDASTVVDANLISALLAVTSTGPLSAVGGRLWRCEPSSLPALLTVARRPAGSRDIPGTHAWTPPRDALCFPIATDGDRVRAEATLLERLGRPDDSWLTRALDRRLSRVLTRRLMHTRLRPNQITVASITIGIVGGLAFSVGSYAAASAGALLFLLSTIIDGCDGELARLTYRESRAGALLDIIGDNVVHVVLFAGIALGLYRVMPADHVALLGVVLLLGVLSAVTAVYVHVVRRTPNDYQRRVFETFAGREFAYLLAAMTLAGRLDLFLWVAAIGIHVFASSFWILDRLGDAPPE